MVHKWVFFDEKHVENYPNEKMEKKIVTTKLEHSCKHDQIQK